MNEEQNHYVYCVVDEHNNIIRITKKYYDTFAGAERYTALKSHRVAKFKLVEVPIEGETNVDKRDS